jgi:hypothetical protein
MPACVEMHMAVTFTGNVIDPIHVMEGISLADLQATLAVGNLDATEVKKASEGRDVCARVLVDLDVHVHVHVCVCVCV